MKFEEYIASVPHSLSEVKLKILKTLWEAGDGFPRPWVKSTLLLKITKQKYFDRRTRELRDEQGIDIETKQIDGQHCYRLVSAKMQKANPRQYLSASQKAALFETAKNTCQVCGKKCAGGVRGLQADHKVPLVRGGSQDIGNWQTICNECNVVKRRVCEGCDADCNTCPWAFPEKFGGFIRLNLSGIALSRLKVLAGGSASKMAKIAEKLLEKAINEED